MVVDMRSAMIICTPELTHTHTIPLSLQCGNTHSLFLSHTHTCTHGDEHLGHQSVHTQIQTEKHKHYLSLSLSLYIYIYTYILTHYLSHTHTPANMRKAQDARADTRVPPQKNLYRPDTNTHTLKHTHLEEMRKPRAGHTHTHKNRQPLPSTQTHTHLDTHAHLQTSEKTCWVPELTRAQHKK